jgi:hypothetical protein
VISSKQVFCAAWFFQAHRNSEIPINSEFTVAPGTRIFHWQLQQA